MTLIEKVQQANKIAAEIISQHPEITKVWFEFSDIPAKEIEDREKDVYADISIIKIGYKSVLSLQAQDKESQNVTIFARSGPIKLIKPQYTVEV